MSRPVWIAAVVLLVVGAGVVAIRIGAARAPSVAAGLVDGGLAPCESPSNCVTTTGIGTLDRVDPLVCPGTDQRADLVRLIEERGWTIQTQRTTDDRSYLAVEAVTRVLRFRDDVEFLVTEGDDWIRVRSASRIGSSDLGTNRARVEALRADLAETCG